MLKFLRNSRQLLNSSKESVCLVLGNESCDLDSAVCAISLAYFYKQEQPHDNFLPVLNIARWEYPVKTEVNFLFKQFNICDQDLTFRDDLPIAFAKCRFILVDHHVSPFAERCIEVFDHRPQSAAANLPIDCKLHLEMVGSCATLIAAYALQSEQLMQNTDLTLAFQLLRSTIVLDTVNFSKDAERATAKDLNICNALEQHLSKAKQQLPTRDLLFTALCKARADISALTPALLLRKDLKILNSPDHTVRVAIPGFPLLVENFLARSEAVPAVLRFAAETRCSVILLLGMQVLSEEHNKVRRDIGLMNINLPDLFDNLRNKLEHSLEPNLNLTKREELHTFGEFYVQHNVKATRKHILPLVQQVLEDWAANV